MLQMSLQLTSYGKLWCQEWNGWDWWWSCQQCDADLSCQFCSWAQSQFLTAWQRCNIDLDDLDVDDNNDVEDADDDVDVDEVDVDEDEVDEDEVDGALMSPAQGASVVTPAVEPWEPITSPQHSSGVQDICK